MPTTPAQQAHYFRNRERYIEQAKEGKKRAMEQMRLIKTSSPCMDCNSFYPAECMDFDHRDGEKKISMVSTMAINGTSAKMLAEIAKCDLVCANCHRIRTAKRMRERNNL